ncbi:MAG: DMT family transporter [Rhodobacteraceae bacterium]|nr:DMT family transporter [Paracoccaceae bacterium]
MSDGHPLHAAKWMLGAIVSFTAMAIAGRALAVAHDTFEIMTYRSLIGVVIVLGVAARAGTLHQITRRRLHVHLTRNACHFTGQNLWFFAITAAPLAQVFALEFTTPIWAMLLAPFFLGERLTRIRILSAAMGFAGVLVVAQPGLGFTLTPGLMAAGIAAIGFAGTAIFTRMLTRTETITCILVYLTTFQAVFGLITAGYDGEVALPTLGSAPWLLLVGCAGLLAHFCMTKALALAPAAVVMPIDFARLPIIALVGMAFYAEPLQWPVLAGALVIFAANFINIRAETRIAADR